MSELSPPFLQSRRALLHPVWLGSLAVLACNDHLLKGADLLPGLVTGKLSDFAGLMVAPLLLAFGLRIRSRTGWLIAHLIIGIVFAGIQVSTMAANSWSALMGLVGFPWVITQDVWDLIALPMLALSYWSYPRIAPGIAPGIGPGIAPSIAPSIANAPTVTGPKLAIHGAAAGVGLFCSVATSDDTERATIFAASYVHNANDFEIVVRTRILRPEVVLDCDRIAQDPGGLLTAPLFGNVDVFALEPDQKLELTAPDQYACWAALVEAENVTPFIVFIPDVFDAEQLHNWSGLGEGRYTSIAYDADAQGSVAANSAYEPYYFATGPASEVAGGGVCGSRPAQERVQWSDELPEGDWRLGPVSVGVDGCLDIELRTGWQDQQDLEGTRWYLCLPQGAFPFAAGDNVRILPVHGGRGSSGLTITELEADSTAELEGGAKLRISELDAPGPWGVTAEFVTNDSCGPYIDTCGSVATAGSLELSGWGSAPFVARTSEPASVTNAQGEQAQFYVTFAEQRWALDLLCTEGIDPSTELNPGEFLGSHAQLVAVRRGVKG